jgi:predicted alpha/beta-fold hydrolase
MHHVVQHVRNLYPGALMFAIGFSCGGNLVANYQATHAGSTPFVAAASVGNGYDLVSGLKLLAGSKWADGVVVTFLKDIFVDR